MEGAVFWTIVMIAGAMFGIASAGSDKTTGYPNGSVHLHQTVAGIARSADRPA